jgi:H+/gluconate symporter-like permease
VNPSDGLAILASAAEPVAVAIVATIASGVLDSLANIACFWHSITER